MHLITETRFITTLNREAKLYVALPKSYENTQNRYPVLYMMDGQNLFVTEDSTSGNIWDVAGVFETHPELKEVIVVALSASKANNGRGRFSEYSIFDLSFGHQVKTRPIEGKGRLTLSFLVDELKPEIDQRYRTLSDKSNTALMGSSMGAVLVNQAAILYPSIFGRVACLSGAYFVAMDQISQLNETADLSKLDYCYLDVGDHEEGLASPDEYLKTNLMLAEILKTKISTKKLCFRIIKGGIHHESAWQTRLDEILALLFT